MTRTFEEMAAERDPVYAEMPPLGDMWTALFYDTPIGRLDSRWEFQQNSALLAIVIRALRNQGQPYYDARQS